MKDRFEALFEAHDRATLGPYRVEDDEGKDVSVLSAREYPDIPVAVFLTWPSRPYPENKHDAEFLVKAHDVVPDLRTFIQLVTAVLEGVVENAGCSDPDCCQAARRRENMRLQAKALLEKWQGEARPGTGVVEELIEGVKGFLDANTDGDTWSPMGPEQIQGEFDKLAWKLRAVTAGRPPAVREENPCPTNE
jgi:hypothetical protein